MQDVIESAKKKCYLKYGNENQEEKIVKLYDDIIESIGEGNETR